MRRPLALLALVTATLTAASCDLVLEINVGHLDHGSGTGGLGGTGGASFCTSGEKQECYTGPDGTKGQGICKAGEQTCNSDGMGFGDCEGQQLPKPEDCATPMDEDCNGLAPACEGLCLWSVAIGDSQEQAGSRITIDEAGNVFLLGTFSGSIDIGNGAKTSAQGGDVFVAQFTADGTPGWITTFQGQGLRTPRSISLDAQGGLVVSGVFSGSTDFGGGTVSANGPSLFVVKLSAKDGSYTWSKAFGPAGLQDVSSSVDGAGDIIIAGGFAGALDLGGGSLSANNMDAFVAKLDGSDGSHIWSKKIGDVGLQTATNVAFVEDGSVLVVGAFTDNIDLGNGSMASNGDFDTFAAKLDGNGGSGLWSKAFGDATNHPLHRIAITATGEAVIAGTFSGTADFGGGPLKSSGAGIDLFVAKIRTDDGTHVWSRAFGTIGDQPISVQTDAAGHVALAGSFQGVIDFGDVPGNNTLASIGVDVFVAKLSAEGKYIWSKRFGDPKNQPTSQACNGLGVDGAGNLFLVGRFDGGLNFGCGELTSAGQGDIFAGRLGP